MKTTIQQNLATGNIWKLLLQYSGPAVIAFVCTSLYNIIDSIFIGREVGAMALTALAICLPLMNLVIAFVNLVAAGGAAVSSIYLGKKRTDLATSTLNNVVLLSLVHSLVFGGLMFLFLKDFLYWFGATTQTFDYAYRFMRIILFGTPISYLFIGLNNLLRATGYPMKAMVSAIFSVVVNLIVAPIMIIVLKQGMEGAAIATVCGQTVALIWVLSHFLNSKNLVHIDKHQPWFSPEVFKHIYAIGLSPFLMNTVACLVVVLLNHSLLKYGGKMDGNFYVGAYGIINRVTMVFIMIVFGVTQGMQPILGFNWGAGNWQRVRSTLNKGILLGMGITTIGWILTQTVPDKICSMFTSDAYMTRLAVQGFHIFFLFYPIVGLQIVVQNFFQSINKPALSILLSTTRQFLFVIPFLFILPHFLGVKGVWWSMTGADLLAAAVAVILLWIYLPKIRHELENSIAKQPDEKS